MTLADQPDDQALIPDVGDNRPPMTLEEIKVAVISGIEREVNRLLGIRDRLEASDLTGPEFVTDLELRQQLTYLAVLLNTNSSVHASSILEILPPKELKPTGRHAWAEGAD